MVNSKTRDIFNCNPWAGFFFFVILPFSFTSSFQQKASPKTSKTSWTIFRSQNKAFNKDPEILRVKGCSWKGLPLLQCLMNLEWHVLPAAEFWIWRELGMAFPKNNRYLPPTCDCYTTVWVSMIFISTYNLDEWGWWAPTPKKKLLFFLQQNVKPASNRWWLDKQM